VGSLQPKLYVSVGTTRANLVQIIGFPEAVLTDLRMIVEERTIFWRRQLVGESKTATYISLVNIAGQ
jgi:hypothetical protein